MIARDSYTAPRRLMWLAIPALLLFPLIAMSFTDEVAWTAFDFAAAALLLGGTALAVELTIRSIRARALRMAATSTVLLAGVALWLQGAVGLI